MSIRTAMQHPMISNMVLMPEGYTELKRSAEHQGYEIVEYSSAGFLPSTNAAKSQLSEKSWRSSLMSIAEGRTRPSALAEILHTQSSATLPFESARAFLRGLPHEQPEGPEAVTTASDPKAVRLAEIDASMATFNKNNNVYRAKKPAAVVSSLNTMDPSTLKRLAEIRLGAITTRLERGESSLRAEHKSLSYAMRVHNVTGQPLATTFTQLGVDTSKMLSKEFNR